MADKTSKAYGTEAASRAKAKENAPKPRKNAPAKVSKAGLAYAIQIMRESKGPVGKVDVVDKKFAERLDKANAVLKKPTRAMEKAYDGKGGRPTRAQDKDMAAAWKKRGRIMSRPIQAARRRRAPGGR